MIDIKDLIRITRELESLRRDMLLNYPDYQIDNLDDTMRYVEHIAMIASSIAVELRKHKRRIRNRSYHE